MRDSLCIGRVRHSRFRPRVHRFSYSTAMLLVNLDHLDGGNNSAVVPSWLSWLFPIRKRDHLRAVQGAGGQSLKATLNSLVEKDLSEPLPAESEVYLLTGFGFLLHRFNPASFYFCFDPQGKLRCVVAEVTNTPWNEQSYYVLDARSQNSRGGYAWDSEKHFHVSPFMPMDTRYRWRIVLDQSQLLINIAVSRRGEPLFNACLRLCEKPLTSLALLGAMGRQPFMSIGVVARIYWQAFRLWIKSVPFFTHPRYRVGDKS